MPKKAASPKDYLNNIKSDQINSGLWDPPGDWLRLHGDGKSSTNGSYHIKTMLDSNGVYKAKVVGPLGLTYAKASWPAGTSPAPSFTDVVNGLLADV